MVRFSSSNGDVWSASFCQCCHIWIEPLLVQTSWSNTSCLWMKNIPFFIPVQWHLLSAVIVTSGKCWCLVYQLSRYPPFPGQCHKRWLNQALSSCLILGFFWVCFIFFTGATLTLSSYFVLSSCGCSGLVANTKPEQLQDDNTK